MCPEGLGPVGVDQQIVQWVGLDDSVLWCVQSASALAQQMSGSCWALQTAAAGNSIHCGFRLHCLHSDYTATQNIDMIMMKHLLT